MECGRGELLYFGLRHACCADHVNGAGLSCEGGKLQRCCRRCEINHRLGAGKTWQRVAFDEDAEGAEAAERADILPDGLIAFALYGADETGLARLDDCFDEHLAHTARGSCDNDSRQVRHICALINSSVSAHSAAMDAWQNLAERLGEAYGKEQFSRRGGPHTKTIAGGRAYPPHACAGIGAGGYS